jgi:hypothetical protein
MCSAHCQHHRFPIFAHSEEPVLGVVDVQLSRVGTNELDY